MHVEEPDAAASPLPAAATKERRTRFPDLAPYCTEVVPRLCVAGFAVASVTIDRTAAQVVATSEGRIASLSRLDRARIFRRAAGKQTAITFVQYFFTRELKFSLDAIQPSPGFSTMVSCGITGVPFSSLQYNWAIQDTYRYFQMPPPASAGLVAHFRQKVAPGIFWAFLRASIATGGGLYAGTGAAAGIDGALRGRGVDAPPLASKVLGSLATGAGFSLLTQGAHNAALVAGRMAVLGETREAPHFTGIALRTAWREMGPSMLYANFGPRLVIQAVSVCILSLCDIFHRPEISGWPAP